MCNRLVSEVGAPIRDANLSAVAPVRMNLELETLSLSTSLLIAGLKERSDAKELVATQSKPRRVARQIVEAVWGPPDVDTLLDSYVHLIDFDFKELRQSTQVLLETRTGDAKPNGEFDAFRRAETVITELAAKVEVPAVASCLRSFRAAVQSIHHWGPDRSATQKPETEQTFGETNELDGSLTFWDYTINLDHSLKLIYMSHAHKEGLVELMAQEDVQEFVPWATSEDDELTPDQVADATITRWNRSRSSSGIRYAILVDPDAQRFSGKPRQRRLQVEDVDWVFAGVFSVFLTPSDFKIEAQPDTIEFGYALLSDYRGKGIVSQVIDLMRPQTHKAFPELPHVLCVNDQNEAGQVVAERHAKRTRLQSGTERVWVLADRAKYSKPSM